MVVKKIEGGALRDDIKHLVVEGRLINYKATKGGWVEQYFLPEYDLNVTFGHSFRSKTTVTKIRGDEGKIGELEESLVLTPQ